MRVPDLSPALIQQAADGDRRAIEAIVRALERPFYFLALRMILPASEAEDATQECLLRVVTRLSQFRKESRFSTWAWRVAMHCLLDARRRHRGAPLLSFETFAADLKEGLDPKAPERADDRALLSELKIGCGRALLQCLDEDHRAAYIVGEVLDFDGEEAASILETTAPTFRKRLSRARARVREALEAGCGIVNPEAECLCHRRLARARELGRISPHALRSEALDVVDLRNRIQTLDQAERAAAYYRADPATCPGRDLARAALEAFSAR
jgi:RNA polymerase sigma factor (sigma-70 family)